MPATLQPLAIQRRWMQQGVQATKMKISSDPKKWDLLDLHAPVLLDGKILDPHISIGRKIPIPLPDFGGAKDAPCDQLTRQIMNDG